MVSVRLAAIVLLLLFAAVIAAPAQITLRALGRRRERNVLQGLLCRALCAGLGLRIHIVGEPPTPGPPVLVVANHVSWTDIPVLGSVGPLTFLAKSEIGRWPLVGLLARSHGTLFVERGKRRALPAMNKTIARSMASGRPVVLFAEATTGDGTRLLPFSAVHVAAARDLLAENHALSTVGLKPVSIAFTQSCGLHAGRAERMRLAWPGDVLLLPHLLDVLRSAPSTCEITWGTEIAFSRQSERKAATRLARRQVKRSLEASVRGAPPDGGIPQSIPVSDSCKPACQFPGRGDMLEGVHPDREVRLLS